MRGTETNETVSQLMRANQLAGEARRGLGESARSVAALDESARLLNLRVGQATWLAERRRRAAGDHQDGMVPLMNPYLCCDTCGQRVSHWHDRVRCATDCDGGSAPGGWWNAPCGHVSTLTSVCETWALDRRCACVEIGWSTRTCALPPLPAGAGLQGQTPRLEIVDELRVVDE